MFPFERILRTGALYDADLRISAENCNRQICARHGHTIYMQSFPRPAEVRNGMLGSCAMHAR